MPNALPIVNRFYCLHIQESKKYKAKKYNSQNKLFVPNGNMLYKLYLIKYRILNSKRYKTFLY